MISCDIFVLKWDVVIVLVKFKNYYILELNNSNIWLVFDSVCVFGIVFLFNKVFGYVLGEEIEI